VVYLLLLAILGLVAAPFAISGYRRAWRFALAVWILPALYVSYVWTQPYPPDMQETDRIGAGAFLMILSFLVIGSAVAFAFGLALSAACSRRQSNSKEAVE